MFKSKNQFNIIYLCLITFIGFIFILNKQIYASPGINLDIRKAQLEEEIFNLQMELGNIHVNQSLTRESRLNQIRSRIAILNPLRNELSSINQQIIRRNQYNQQIQNNQN
ncbi:MAG: SVM family protein [Lettuce witches'-broom phytoplasma]